MFEAFAGIGAQHKAINNIDIEGKSFKVVKTSEWDARAIIAYAQIHHKKEFDRELNNIVNKMTEKQLDNHLEKVTISLNSKTPVKVLRKNLNFKRNLYSALKVNNTFPDITKVSGKELVGIDLMTYSFPCQGLSIANMGRDQGIKESSESTSNLIWQIRRMLLEAKKSRVKLPKYLLMENVKNLIGKKHIGDYEKWVKFLKDMGYTTKTIVLNALDHNGIQIRKRVFGISIKNWKNEMKDQEFQKWFHDHFARKMTLTKRKNKYLKILRSSDSKLDEIKDAVPNNTPSRVKMAKNNRELLTTSWSNIEHKYTFNTQTTKQDRHPNIGMIKLAKKFSKKNKLSHRFITPREAYQIMGFTSNDFDRVKEKYKEGTLTKESLYRQAGNSIVVQVLEDIFKFIKKFEGGEYD